MASSSSLCHTSCWEIITFVKDVVCYVTHEMTEIETEMMEFEPPNQESVNRKFNDTVRSGVNSLFHGIVKYNKLVAGPYSKLSKREFACYSKYLKEKLFKEEFGARNFLIYSVQLAMLSTGLVETFGNTDALDFAIRSILFCFLERDMFDGGWRSVYKAANECKFLDKTNFRYTQPRLTMLEIDIDIVKRDTDYDSDVDKENYSGQVDVSENEQKILSDNEEGNHSDDKKGNSSDYAVEMDSSNGTVLKSTGPVYLQILGIELCLKEAKRKWIGKN